LPRPFTAHDDPADQLSRPRRGCRDPHPVLPRHALDQRPAGDPELTFVIFMCVYAGEVLSGILPGPYTEQNARRYVRACLIPTELLERPRLDITAAAGWLQIPDCELCAARDEHQAELIADWLLPPTLPTAHPWPRCSRSIDASGRRRHA
jgi:hypothetical protein